MNFTFLTGAAGTGKTHTIKTCLQQNPLFGIVTATTGIAAINTNGITLNTLLGFYNYADLYYKYRDKFITRKLENIRDKGYLNIIVDEASMLGNNTLDILYNCFEEANQNSKQSINLILVGDLLQLPPVKEASIIKAQSWKYFKHQLLKDVKRQTNREFIECLNNLRLGNLDTALDYLADKEVFHNNLDMSFLGTTIFATNREVDNYNAYQLNKLNSKERVYITTISGTPNPDWKTIPSQVVLKENALVMITTNGYEVSESSNKIYHQIVNSVERPQLVYVNGDLGICKELKSNGVVVELLRNKEKVFVGYITRYYELFTDKKRKTLGTIRYLPIRVAYGTTLHKSQGLTLDRVQIELNSSFLKRIEGGLYVALSRVRTIEGLRLIGNVELFRKQYTYNPEIVSFYKALNNK